MQAYHRQACLASVAHRSKTSAASCSQACFQATKCWKVVAPLLQDNGGTSTVMRSFVLCGDRQLHDVHSKLRLSHPSGNAVQLHK